MGNELLELPAGSFAKEDSGDDAAFYALPRMVAHIDESAIAALTAFYRTTLQSGGTVLDLMSSWISHLPPEMVFANVIGHGMNADEFTANPRLSRSIVQDLNRSPTLPLVEGSVDAALCYVGVQYLEHPTVVFTEVRRVLRRGAPIVISFSNRCFPTKAVAIWRALDARNHMKLVRLYLARAGFDSADSYVLADGTDGDPITVVVGYA